MSFGIEAPGAKEESSPETAVLRVNDCSRSKKNAIGRIEWTNRKKTFCFILVLNLVQQFQCSSQNVDC